MVKKAKKVAPQPMKAKKVIKAPPLKAQTLGQKVRKWQEDLRKDEQKGTPGQEEQRAKGKGQKWAKMVNDGSLPAWILQQRRRQDESRRSQGIPHEDDQQVVRQDG